MASRDNIITAFAEWTAFSATRSGCQIKKKEMVYPLIRTPAYSQIFHGGPIATIEFDLWHRRNTLSICEREPVFPIGWAAKLINVYLKTKVYLAGEGRPGLIDSIHPPIDNELWKGIQLEYRNRPEIITKTHTVSRIKEIASYEIYTEIINGCRLVAADRGCRLIEVEELWQGTVVSPISSPDVREI